LPHAPQCGAPRSLGLIRFYLPHPVQTRVETGPETAEGDELAAGAGPADVVTITTSP
jgi:hypothetical protein